MVYSFTHYLFFITIVLLISVVLLLEKKHYWLFTHVLDEIGYFLT